MLLDALHIIRDEFNAGLKDLKKQIRTALAVEGMKK